MKCSVKSIVLFPFLLAVAVMLLSGVALAGLKTQVVLNKSVLVNLNKPAERVSVANPAIADMILISPRQIQLIGQTLGSTSLIVWEKGGDKPLFFDVNVVNNTNVEDSQQVLLQVKVAQVDKSSMKNLGISFMVKNENAAGFSNIIGAPDGGLGSSIMSGMGEYNPLDAYTMGITHFPSGITAVLKALAEKNFAKILAEPNLLVKSGQKGNFLAGSRIPYNIVTSTGGTATTSIVFVDVGVKINFAPEVMDNGTIHLKIDPAEVSTVQGTLAVNGYPVIDTREVRTSVELKDGESLVLAGLLQEDKIKAMSKVPILGDIPILGALFRSTDDEIKEKELVFFITPQLVTPQAPGVKTELPTDKELTPEQEREMQWIPTLK